MPVFQTDLIFSDFGARDWIETFFDENSSAEAASLFSAGEVEAVMACRARGIVLKAVRSSEVSNLRRTSIRTYNAVTTTSWNTFGTLASGRPDITGVAAKFNIPFESHGARTLSVRGLPDDHVSRLLQDGTHSLTGQLNDQLTRYRDFVLANFKGQRKIDSGQVPWMYVRSLAKHVANPEWTEVKYEPGGLASIGATDTIYFRFLDRDRFPYIQGDFPVIQVLDANRFVIGVRWRDPLDEVFLRRAQVRRVQYEYPALVGWNFLGFGTRDTGGPTSRHRGRQPARFSRR